MVSQRIQELFKKACFLTAVQGKPAIYNGTCMYLTTYGTKCAVGQVIPDGHPAQYHRGAVSSLLDNNEDLESLLTDSLSDRSLWTGLQTVHDMLHDNVTCHPRSNLGAFRPFGVEWSQIFWLRADYVARKHGFSIGSYPRAAINEARS